MKTKVLFILTLAVAGFMLYSCSTSSENKIAGTWKVEDVIFDSSNPMSEAQILSSKESAKTVSYELMKDHSAKILAGSTVLEGTWEYREAEAGVYMVFTDSFDTVLIGRYEEGKLINEATRPDIKITTIFVKEEQ